MSVSTRNQEDTMGEGTTDELHALRQQIRAAQRERLDIESHLGNPDALRSATARALRDRDAVTSPALEEARTKIARDIAALRSQWHRVDRARHIAERFARIIEEAPEAVRDHYHAIGAELPEVRRIRARIATELRLAGLGTVVSEGQSTDG
ncbi:hypothetical protein [Mycobacteroides abscessus]|uniref:hypothetical protein n=1 Tax=Mycobacteroides abscessus TaxID=36809 RepID=UPI001F341FD3|nr:hypothetical protein [Mycobacteroides abscessus]